MRQHPKTIAGIIALLVFSSVFLQLVLMIQAPSNDAVLQVIIRFLSYFTILSNLIVCAYFISLAMASDLIEQNFWKKPETGTAVTVYISVVGLVYHIVLSKLYHPQGLALIADHGLHSFAPLATVLFWFVFVSTKKVNYASIPFWLIYPGLYFVYTVIHGYFSQFYPYPFLDISKIGFLQALINCLMVLVLFSLLSVAFSFIANKRYQKNNQSYD